MISPERIVTLDRPAGFRIVRDLGTVQAEATARRGLVRAALRSTAAFLGLAPADVVSDAERARSRCLGALRERADEIGADGVIGVAFEALERTDGATIVRAHGTAVLLEPEGGR